MTYATLTPKQYIKIISELSKVRITFAVSLTTLTGYILASRSIGTAIILPTLGIFLLACSSSVINHLQEYPFDARMQRTRMRPLPAGIISVQFAVILSFIEGVLGGLLLYVSAGLTAFLLGMLALIWYNLVYTRLKRVLANAVVPGSLIGAIPPLVGWVAAGKSIWVFDAMYMALFFFIWQIPHFYLLSIKYSSEYEQAGYPTLLQHFSEKQLRTIIYIWIIVTSVFSVGFYFLTDVLNNNIVTFILAVFSIWFIFTTRRLIQFKIPFSPGKYFMKINYYVLTVIVLLIIGGLI
ncbi:MAG: hypothetical protein GVY19_05325 [Bacteroidetes bacterium]|jgi:protoheme IX farnesyltransferase|nr:hypothetical protein [Bacteroidota bacterium]